MFLSVRVYSTLSQLLPSMAHQMKSSARLNSVSVRLRYLFLLAMVFGSSFIIISISNRTEIFLINNEQPLDYHHHEYDNEASFTIKTEGCTIPSLIAFDETVKKFNTPPKNLKSCLNANNSLLQHNKTYIWIDTGVLQYYNISKDANISCCYQPFYRPKSVENVYSDQADDRVHYEDCQNFSNYMKVGHEYVKVTCECNKKQVYQQYYLSAGIKKIAGQKPKKMKPENISYNVIVMGTDAISRLNFHRTMPKTLAYLKKKGAIELLGYNKVGDNSFPNLMPLLLGVSENELKKTCWPDNDAYFDNCPFIWHWFKQAGFYTAVGEDSAALGTFNYQKNGFMKQPTDYYIRTFVHEAENNVGNNFDFNEYICMGNEHFYKVLLDYIQDLTVTLRSYKLFGFFWEISMSHDYLTYPMAMDDGYETFLEKLDSNNYLDKTVLILLSDHGIRWGGIRYTKQGRLEERLPFVHILLPPSFQKNYNLAYDNLLKNSKRLTTPFDVHATLTDLIDLQVIDNKNIKQRMESPYTQSRSISLFLPIPTNRTCKMADIDDHWCTCHKGKKISPKSLDARDAGKQLVKHINEYLKEHKQCAQLTLAEVLDVTEMMVGVPREGEAGWREFMAVVRTTPGAGVFEGTLRQRGNTWRLAGTISRLNLYGKQSRCMHHYQLKLYCYCL